MAGSSVALYTTVYIYGGIFLLLLTMHCLVRNRFPMAFSTRNMVPELRCPLASREFGMFSWIFGVFLASDREMFEQCGLDAIAFIRMVQMGFKISFVGCLTAVFVMPVYNYAPETSDNSNVTDPLDKCSIAHLSNNDPGMYATVLASYLIFGYMIYLLYSEFEWYIANRHQILSRPCPENYTVFVFGIPRPLESRKTLYEFFSALYDDVIDVRFALDVSQLEPLAKKREKLAAQLEHATNVLVFTGKRPERSSRLLCGGRKDAIAELSLELASTRAAMAAGVADLDARYARHEALLLDPPAAADAAADPLPAGVPLAGGRRLVLAGHRLAIVRGPHGKPVRDGAFISFGSLRSAAAARDAVHLARPFALSVTRAPAPDDVCWGNVGVGHAAGQASAVAAGACTTALCVLWTVPVAFVATLTQIDSLETLLPFLRDAARAFPLLDQVLAQVAPVALIVLGALLPVFLTAFARMEGHAAEAAVQASLYSKLTLFKVVQTFFVSAISGSVFAALMQLAADPVPIVLDILGRKLPAQASFFMQLTLVQTFLGLGLELLRPVPCAIAAVRRLLGPGLTPKERAAPWMGLSPLSSPGTFDQPGNLSDLSLMFVILLAYAVLSPVTCFVMAFCFAATAAACRNQFIYIYDPRGGDTGGLLWPRAIQAAVMCLVVAELMVVAVLAFKQAAGPTPLMLPLPVATVLFYRYLGQQHYRVADSLPLDACARADAAALAAGAAGGECARGKYVQPALEPEEEEEEGGGARAGAAGAGRRASEESGNDEGTLTVTVEPTTN